ncbi:MAG: helix-turn-helix domain-containing protein [Clostridiales bacterium]|nr:helix-turn-helix domain-containing protein [Eubacteriales bacterium]MDH7566723.1 helix-turn-helix domain-containing protein [Clostridiales bacterium]
MEIKLYMLLERLKHYSLESYLYDENAQIKTVKLLAKNALTLDPEVLYLTDGFLIVDSILDGMPANILFLNTKPMQKSFQSSNLILLQCDKDIIEIFNEIQEILEMFRQWSLKLVNCLVLGKGLEQIIDVGYELLNNPITVIDASFNILAYSKGITWENSLYQESVALGHVPDEYVLKVKSGKNVERVYKSRTPIIECLQSEDNRKIISNIVIGSKIVGHLVVHEYNNPFKKADLEIAAFLSNVISAEMQKSKFFRNTMGVMYEYFIIDLLEGKLRDDESVEKKLKYLDLHLKENLYVLTIETSRFIEKNTPNFQIKDYIESMIYGSKAIFYNDNIVMIISRSRENMINEAELSDLEEFLQRNHIFGGISRCFTNIINLQKFYMQSLKAIEIGTRIFTGKALFNYESCAVYNIMDAYSKEELLDFCHPSLLSLIEYDKINNTTYVQSLHTYITNDKRKVESADYLHIHRNTMNYRISKIKNIMKVDLDDRDLLFHLNISFKILEYVNKMKYC